MPRRRLVAVMFTDIVEYTTVMHHNEEAAIGQVERHQEVVEACVAAHQGEVFQYYGDGSLTLFDDAVAAVACALEIQRRLKEEPKVPLRIGIHTGEIRREGGKVYGDAINLASRIESIGQEGTILFSGDVFEKIRGHSDFKAASLGPFEFKNVDEPIEIYALANEHLPIPKREEMTGKLKQPKAPTGSAKNLWKRPALLLALLVIVAATYWRTTVQAALTLPDSIKEARIAVLPYENNTNDANLDVLGEMIADWIIQGMMNLEDLQVVSYQTVRDVVREEQAVSEMKFRSSFQRQTGAQKMLRGAYYLQDDQLMFQSQIIDVRSGNVEFVLPEITGDRVEVMDLVNELRQRILGYFSVMEDNFLLLQHRPPKYEAYKAYLEAYSYFGTDYAQSRRLCHQAISIDSSFLWPYLTMAGSYYNQGNSRGVDSVIALVNRRFKHLNSYERAYLDWAMTMTTSDLEDDYERIKPIFARDPQNLRNNYLMGYSASMLNKPAEAVNYFQEIDPANLDIKYQAQTWWHLVYAYNLIRLERLDDALHVLRFVPEALASLAYYYRLSDIYMVRGQTDSLLLLINAAEENGLTDELLINMYVYISLRYRISGDPDRYEQWYQLMIDRMHSQSLTPSEELLAGIHYFSERYPEALPFYLEQISAGNVNWYYLARIGCIYARQGDTTQAMETIRNLEQLDTPETIGQFRYAIAMIYSMLGENAQAVNDMKKAFAAGFGFTSSRYKDAFEFLPMQGYPPYDEFVRPRE